MKLGEKKKEEAAKGVGNGIVLSTIISTIFCVICLCFLPQLLDMFGCTDALRQYALDYGYVISIGLPFMIIGVSLNSIIRADGSPRYAMISMVLGAVINMILDPIFIYALGLGIKGAAIATILSQFITFIINIVYIRKLKSIKLSKETFKLKIGVTRKVIVLGISSFITQVSFVFVIATENNLLGKYGLESKFGSEIPITVLGIVMKVSQILTSVIIGITVGAQPIFGYNFGARKFDRVKLALKKVLITSVGISIFAFILFQTIPDKLISIFGNGNELYMEFACITFRTYLMLCIFNGIQIPSGIFFQAIGKGMKSAALSLSRQIVFLIPSMFILGNAFGLMGVLYAGPVADGIAFLLSGTLLVMEIKNLGKAKERSDTLIDDTSTDNKLNRHLVITISREYGSGGRYIGRLIADKLGIKLYDKDFVEKLAEETGLAEEYIENNEQKRNALSALNSGFYSGLSNADELFVKESELIKEVANKESCVIIGRCADFILKDRKDVLKVFVYSSMKDKIKRAVKYYEMKESTAEKEINKINKLRANHYKYYTDKDWNDNTNYDICINSDKLGVEKSADLICDLIK